MARRRSIRCPHCGAPKETAAAARMRVKCSACGQPFRVPNVDDELPEGLPGEAPSPPGPPASSGDPVAPAAVPVSSSGVKVARAKPKVGPPAVDVDEDQGDDVDEDQGDAGAGEAVTPSPQEKAKAAGRRGGNRTKQVRAQKRAGSSTYAGRVGRG